MWVWGTILILQYEKVLLETASSVHYQLLLAFLRFRAWLDYVAATVVVCSFGRLLGHCLRSTTSGLLEYRVPSYININEAQ